MKYRIYIDEVGNHHLGSSIIPAERFLSLTGVIADLDYVRSIIHPQMESLKEKYFMHHPDEPIIFHRKELISMKMSFSPLRDEAKRFKFDNELLMLLESWEYIVITVCLDKKTHLETYKSWRYDPYHYCLAIILERFVFYLEGVTQKGDIMIESRGSREDRRLKKSFNKIWERGTEYIEPERINDVLTSKQLKVKPKKLNIAGLQIADLLAYPSRNEILLENGHLSKDQIKLFTGKLIKILSKKYYSKDGKFYGYGKKFI